MKTLNLSKVALAVVMTTQLLSTGANASTKISKEILFTTNREEIRDPSQLIKKPTIREITNEEAMEFINDGITNKGVTIPPKPNKNLPVINTLEDDGGLVAAGGGGTAAPAATGFFSGVIMVVDKLIAIGQKIMPTIDKGRAVVTNTSMAAVSVLPRLETKDPVVHDMGGWSLPVTKHYQISYKNGYNSEVVSFVYSITFQYNGSLDGKGKYLTGIRASARNINISWGFDLDATSQLIQISNVGSAGNVIAGATIEMSYTVKNWTRQITANKAFFVTGDGRLYSLD